MKVVFQNSDNNIFLSVNTRKNEHKLIDELLIWLEEFHEDIFFEIEIWQGGSVTIEEDSITFKGDNGLFILEKIIIKEL